MKEKKNTQRKNHSKFLVLNLCYWKPKYLPNYKNYSFVTLTVNTKSLDL